MIVFGILVFQSYEHLYVNDCISLIRIQITHQATTLSPINVDFYRDRFCLFGNFDRLGEYSLINFGDLITFQRVTQAAGSPFLSGMGRIEGEWCAG
ncbi:MAG: hypothetical protein F6K41_02440 [Symploca sp. SIO3E6]|nr:hypothetical protein [Caldora sp. SIO3E6]